ncbi:MAG: hypothetical protein Q7S99_07405 [Parvibaculum sp.]|nr:hypothetical protein [Parvibaculum sp.]
MRKIILAASAGAFGLLVAAAPASALSSYTVKTDGGNSFTADGVTPPSRNLSITSTTQPSWSSYGYESAATDRFNSAQNDQQDLSRDMSWQGTGYYLRPNR